MDEFILYSKEKPIDRERFEQLFGILEKSFPKNERRDMEGHFGEFSDPEFRSLILERGGKTAGFINYWELTDSVYVEHFAVSDELRGQGLGKALINKLRGLIGSAPVVLEVEPAVTGEYAIRRIEFYKRLGFCENSHEYLQPPYRKEDKPLKLMIMSSPTPLSASEFSAVRGDIYRIVYKTDFSAK